MSKPFPAISIILPVFNERDIIESVISECHQVFSKLGIRHTLVVCEDGSTDGTTAFLRSIQRKYHLILNQKKYRRGYGQAVLAGIKLAKTEYILCLDSDGQCDPKDFRQFIKAWGRADVLIGWRTTRLDAKQRLIFSALFKKLHKFLFPNSLHDASCPFVLFRKSQFLPLLKYLCYLREGFWWGFVAICIKQHISILELPIHHRLRLKGTTQVYKPKKIPGIALRNIIGLIKLKLIG